MMQASIYKNRKIQFKNSHLYRVIFCKLKKECIKVGPAFLKI